MAVVNQGWSFIKFNRIFMCLLMCGSLCFFSLVPVPAQFFIMSLIRANLFHNLSCLVSHALHVFFVLIHLFLILSYNSVFAARHSLKAMSGSDWNSNIILVAPIFTNAFCVQEERWFHTHCYAATHSFVFHYLLSLFFSLGTHQTP